MEALLTKIMANELVHIGMEQQAEKVRASLWENLQGVPNENKLPRRGKDAGRRGNLLSIICIGKSAERKNFVLLKIVSSGMASPADARPIQQSNIYSRSLTYTM